MSQQREIQRQYEMLAKDSCHLLDDVVNLILLLISMLQLKRGS